jgi:hypothetical protein
MIYPVNGGGASPLKKCRPNAINKACPRATASNLDLQINGFEMVVNLTHGIVRKLVDNSPFL